MQNIFSKKLNKEVPLETYLSEDGLNIVTATSLKKIFEEIKSERGIKEEITWDVRFDANCNFYYAYANYRLRDKDGYDSMFVGESSPATCITDIAKKYPGQMAVNRAIAEGIIAYLQLDINGKAFADIQVPDRKLIANTSADIPSTAPQLNEDMTIPADDSVENNELETINKENAEAIQPAAVVEKVNEDAGGSSEKENSNESTAPTSNGIPVPESNNVSDESINDNTVITFGPYTNKTVAQLFENAKSDVKAQRTICVAKKGLGVPEKDKAVFAYIADKATKLGL